MAMQVETELTTPETGTARAHRDADTLTRTTTRYSIIQKMGGSAMGDVERVLTKGWGRRPSLSCTMKRAPMQ